MFTLKLLLFLQFYLKKPIILLNLQPPLENQALYTIKNILVVFEDMAIKNVI